jgi:hypothetical protein
MIVDKRDCLCLPRGRYQDKMRYTRDVLGKGGKKEEKALQTTRDI